MSGAMLGRDPGPRCELVAREPQPDDRGRRRRPDRLDHLTGEAEPVAGPSCVVALVRESRQELAHQAVLAGIDLDAVAAGVDGDPRRAGEPIDDGRDVVGLHRLGDLSRVDLGHPRRRPQRALAVRRRTLATGVVERCDDERAVRSTRSDDRRPNRRAHRSASGARSYGQSDSWTQAPSDHDRAAAAARPALVVGHVAGRDRAVVVAEIGDVRAEHDAVRCVLEREGDGSTAAASARCRFRLSECSSRSTIRLMLLVWRTAMQRTQTDRRRRAPTGVSVTTTPIGTQATTAMIDAIDALPDTRDTMTPETDTSDGDDRLQDEHRRRLRSRRPCRPGTGDDREHVTDDGCGAQPVARWTAVDEQAEPGRQRALQRVEHEHPDALAPPERAVTLEAPGLPDPNAVMSIPLARATRLRSGTFRAGTPRGAAPPTLLPPQETDGFAVLRVVHRRSRRTRGADDGELAVAAARTRGRDRRAAGR